jgi:hypothetical protein
MLDVYAPLDQAAKMASAAVPCVRHCSPVICSIARFMAHGVYRPSGFGVASGSSFELWVP